MNTTPELIAGQKLKLLRYSLLLTRKNLNEATKIPTSTLERIENGELPYPIKWLNSLCTFYAYSKENLYKVDNLIPDWKTQRRAMLAYHRNDKKTLKILNRKPSPQKALEHRVIKSGFLNSFLSTETILEHLKTKYNWTFAYATLKNSLDSLAAKGCLERRINSSGISEYRRLTSTPTDNYGIIEEITSYLEEITSEKTFDLVNPAFERMAKMLFFLRKGPAKRSEILTYAGYANATNNYAKSLKILDEMRLVEMTLKDMPTSSSQKYRLTITGMEAINKLQGKFDKLV